MGCAGYSSIIMGAVMGVAAEAAVENIMGRIIFYIEPNASWTYLECSTS